MSICLRRREFITGLSPSLKRAAIMLMKLFSSLLCIFSLLLPWREVTAAELPQKLSSAVRAAEADGLALSKASGQPRTIDNPAIEDARGKITNFCEFDYAPVVISRGGVPVIYFLARPTRSEDI